MLLTSLKAVGLADVLDIALVAVLIYALLFWFKRAKAAVVAKGMLIFAAIYVFSKATGMVMTTRIFHGFIAILLVALVVIFQEELRSVFERIAVWSLASGKAPQAPDETIETLVRTMGDLKRERIGALVVLRGKDPLDRHLEGGWPLGGEVSEALLKSIFDDHSLGHDGAVVVDGGRVTRFGCRLPLSKEFSKTARFGTRHTAALGLVELSDALCVVLSEERGTISVAQDGRIESVRGLEELERRVNQFMMDKRPQPVKESIRTFLHKNSREKALAFSASVLLWTVFVLGVKTAKHSYEAVIRPSNIPEELAVESVRPSHVNVIFTAQMRDFFRYGSRPMGVRIDVPLAHKGVNHVAIDQSDISRPPGFILEGIEPAEVEVMLVPRESIQQISRWR